MGHQWSGGEPTKPEAEEDTQASDPLGPNLSEIAWKFFSGFTLAREYRATKSRQGACRVLRG
jgi:hypothetical protein